jgi:protein TonB
LSAYRLPSPYDRPPLERRASGLALALVVNLLLLLLLLTIGAFKPTPPPEPSTALVVDMLPESHRAAAPAASHAARNPTKPVPKPPPIILPVKPTIAVEPAPKLIEMSNDEMAAGDISNLPQAGSGSAGDSEVVGSGPHGEVLYNAEWAREPTNAELGGYMPKNAPDGWGLIACRTIPNNRVEDCVELGNDPPGSHLASAVRQAAWQFRVRPPRKNGRAMVGEWVRIRIDYETIRSN